MRVSLATQPLRSAVLAHETRHLGPERLRGITEQRQRIHTFVRDLVVVGIASGDFDAATHPGVATNTLFEIMDGSQVWYRASGSLSVSQIADWYVTLFLKGIGATSPALRSVQL